MTKQTAIHQCSSSSVFQKKYSIGLLAILLFLLLVIPPAHAGIPFLSETVRWKENVTLQDGNTILIERTVTYAPDQWGRSGRGRTKEQTIALSLNGSRITWENDDSWPIQYLPEIFDIVDGDPVVIMPVHRWGPCDKFNYPKEGLIAYRYHNKKWAITTTSQLPQTLKVNLLGTTHAIQYWAEYKGKIIDDESKRRLQENTWGPKQGASILDASKFYSGVEDSCIRIRPLPDPEFETTAKKIADSESDAKMFSATVIRTNITPETVTADDFRRAKGDWTGTGYISESCKGTVTRIEPNRKYGDGGSWQLVGATLILANGAKVPITQNGLKPFQAPYQIQTLICDQKNIYAIRRKDKENLLVNRFQKSGSLIDSFWIILPDTSNVIPEKGWGDIWGATIKNEIVFFSLVDYTYPALANLGGTINKGQDYQVMLSK